MSVFEVKDCCCEINSHLSLVQLLTVQKYCLWYTKPISIRNTIVARLCELGYDLDVATDVLDAVRKSKSILSGPFMFTVLVTPLDEPLNWDPVRRHNRFTHTIDIYTNIHGSDEICPTIVLSAYERARNYSLDDMCACTLPHIIDSTIFEPPIDDIAAKLFDCHNFDIFKIAYSGNTLLIKELECVLTQVSSVNNMKSIELKYSVMVYNKLKNISRFDYYLSGYQETIIKLAEETELLESELV